VDKIQLAKFFHKTYEDLATGFFYKTREDTKEFNPNSANGKLMIATCGAVLEELSKQSKDSEILDWIDENVISIGLSAYDQYNVCERTIYIQTDLDNIRDLLKQ